MDATEEQAQHGQEHPRHGNGLERDEREPRHQVEVQTDQAEQAVLGLSALPLTVTHVNLHKIASAKFVFSL